MFKHQMPGRVNYDPITLSYGVTTSRDLWMWILDTAAGKIERRNVTISMQDSTGTKVQDAWELVAAWPQKWQGGELDASAGEIALSELTLVYDELKRRTG